MRRVLRVLRVLRVQGLRFGLRWQTVLAPGQVDDAAARRARCLQGAVDGCG